MPRVALDSNILIYAEVEPESEKGGRARDVILRAARDGVIPCQVLGELIRFVQRRAPASLERAVRQVALYRTAFLTPPTTDEVVAAAAELSHAHDLQFWDSVICVTASRAGANVLLTEDMQDGRFVAGLRILSPFSKANAAEIDAVLEN